jgi:hypothetical protein
VCAVVPVFEMLIYNCFSDGWYRLDESFNSSLNYVFGGKK